MSDNTDSYVPLCSFDGRWLDSLPASGRCCWNKVCQRQGWLWVLYLFFTCQLYKHMLQFYIMGEGFEYLVLLNHPVVGWLYVCVCVCGVWWPCDLVVKALDWILSSQIPVQPATCTTGENISKLQTWFIYVLLHQGTGGNLGAHTMAGRHMPVLLWVLGPAPGVCPTLVQEFPQGPSPGWEEGGGGVITCDSSLH